MRVASGATAPPISTAFGHRSRGRTRFRRRAAVRGARSRARGGHVDVPARPERRRQDEPAAPHRRTARAPGPAAASRAATANRSPAASPTWRSRICCCPGFRRSTTCCSARACAASRSTRPRASARAGCSARVGLAEKLAALPAALSGGQRQRVALARTLFEERPLVLMDEPFSALDAITRHQLQALAAELLRGATVLHVTHDPWEALRLADRLYVMAGAPARLGAPDRAAGRSAARRRARAGLAAGTRNCSALARRRHARGGVMAWLRGLIVIVGLIALWQAVVSVTGVPEFILPSPLDVARALVADAVAAGRACGDHARRNPARPRLRHRARHGDGAGDGGLARRRATGCCRCSSRARRSRSSRSRRSW